MSNDDKEQRLQDIGASAMASIAEMVAALECDYDRLEEIAGDELSYKQCIEAYREKMTDWQANADATAALEELAELRKAAGECESREDAEQRIHEDAISVEVRSGWVSYGSQEDMRPEEYCILLSTGGPATRIIGKLNDYGEPTSAKLQVQDLFTPWTDYREADEGYLLAYARCFYFGES
jgi:hypothetical protein